MKIRFFYIVLLLLVGLNSFSQEQWIFFDTKVENELDKPEYIIPITDKLSGNIAIVVKHKKFIIASLYDKNQELISELKIDEFPEEVSNFVGNCGNNLRFTLFYSNNNNSKFGSLAIDFENKNFNIKNNIELNFKGEHLIGSFEENDHIYLVTIVKDTSILKLYTLGVDNSLESKTIDLSQESFEKHNNLKTSLYYLITNNQNPTRLQSSIIKYNTPNSLETTSAVNKIYFQDGLISITNDHNDSHTYLIQINASDGSFTYNLLDKKGFLKEELRSESNSFVFNDYYLSLYTTTSKMVFTVHDIKNDKLLKEYIIMDNDSISFKNTPVIISKGKYTKTKDFNDSNLFLRNLVNSNTGISVYEKNNLFVITLGASEKVQSNGFAIVGGLLGGITGAILFSVFDSYSNTESTRVECLFDKKFNHVNGDVPINGFDKIKTFIDTKKLNRLPLQTVFQYQDSYIWGSYNTHSGFYSLYKFEE